MRIASRLERVSSSAVKIIAIIILAAFTYWAAIYTHMTYIELENLKVRLYEDNAWKNIGCLIILVVVLFCGSKIVMTKEEHRNEKRVHLIAVIATVCVGIVSGIWVVLNEYTPYHDQLQVVEDAMNFLHGDYSDLKGYLEIYPHQIGLVFLYKILFSIWSEFEVIYYMHIIWTMAIVYFTYKISNEIFQNNVVSLYSIIGASLFVPMYFYVNYAYGDLSMAACGVIGIWCMIKYCKVKQIRYAVCLTLILTLGYLARTNMLIVILAMVIVLFISGCNEKSWRMIICSFLIMLIPIVTQRTIISYYEHQADVIMVDGAPAVLHIAMGMQDTYEGPGYYNAYNLVTYVNSGKDADESANIAKTYISNRVEEMKMDIGYTKNFYVTKILQQWNEPSFSGELSTNHFSESPKAVVNSIYYGSLQEFLREFRNYYLFVLYAGALSGVIYKMISDKKEPLWKNIIYVILIGGFLFSIIWENKSRYVMPYVVMMISCSAYGLYSLQQLGCMLLKHLKKNINNIKN